MLRIVAAASSAPRRSFLCCYCHSYEAKFCLRKLILLLFFSQQTPLHYTAEYGHLEVSRLLLQCNADVEAKSDK